jgi:CHAT domain-containing protein/Tfp pilus assembly protein PilF
VLTNIGILHHVRENYSEALNYYARSLKLAEKNNEKSEEGRLLNNIGNIHQMQNDYARALEYYERSLKLARELGDRLLIARALNNVGIIGFLQANLPRALECFEASLEIAEQLGARDIVMRTLTNIGEIHRRRGDFQQAAEFSQRSVKLAEGTGDKDLLMRTLNNAGVIVRTQGDFPQALDYYNRSLKLAEELGSKRQVSTAYNNIGSVYDTQGDYTRASEYFHKGLKVAEEGNDRALVAALLFNIGNLHNKQGNHDQALDFYQKSLEIAEAIANQHDIVLAMNNMSTVYAVQGRFKRALEYLEKSLEIATRLNDRESIVSILSHIGSVHKLEGNYRQALDYYQKSLKSGEELGKRESVADSLNDLAEVQTLQDNFVESLALSNRAAETARQIGAPEALWRARAAAGNAHKALGQPDQARSSLEEAISVIETLRARVAGGEQAQQQFFQNRIGPYDSMVDLLIEQKNLTEALRFAERAKGRVLLDVVQSGRVDITRAMTEQQQAQERGLKLQLASLNSQIQREMIAPTPDRERLADLNDRLNRARLEYEHFEVRLYAEHPGLKIKRGKIEPLDLQQTARLLPDSRAALLEFVVMDEKTYLFVLTKRPSSQGPPGRRIADGGLNLAVYKITVTRKDLAGLVEQFRRSLADLDFSFVSQARSLYDLLLKPARSDLRNKTTLVIVPDDALWELPFNVLQPAPKQYLIEGAAISLAPSLSVLLHMKQVEVDGDRNSPALVAFGTPKIGKPTAERVASVFRDEELGPLPEAERQVKMLGLLYGRTRSRIFLGADAREDRVKAEGSSGRILHLATHGRLSDKNPMYSHLVMAQPEGAAADDGLLEAWEIMRLDLKADLVVFSACETGRGRIGRGEGVIGLAWASFVAGAPTTVVSAWKVDDRSTADLMLEFHRNLRLRKGKAAALRLASLKLLRTKDYKHPFYWAAFLVVGDGR